MGNDRRELAAFLKEVSGWDWHEFLRAEKDGSYTTRQSVVFAMVRAAAMENLGAIATAIGRLDGRIETPVQVVMPKVYFLYPNAASIAEDPQPGSLEKEAPVADIRMIEPGEDEDEMPSRSFRETMERMATRDRGLPGRIIACQEGWEAFANGRGQAPVNARGQAETVKVSSVVAARLLHMAQNRDMKALDEVFNQLDGKLVETVRIVGEDMYIMQFGSVAPPGAVRNEDGVYQAEAPRVAKMWGERLDATRKGLNHITNIMEED